MIRAGLAVLALLVVGACAPTRNFETPYGPRYSGGASAPRVGADRMRVVSFNIRYASALAGVAAALESIPALQRADIILLQETDLASTAWLARRLGLTWAYVPASWHPVSGRDYGNAILSAWPITETAKVLLPHLGRWRGNRRAATAATLCVEGLGVRVYSTHLSTATEIGPGARREQLGAVLEDAEGYAIAIVGGDFNSVGVADAGLARGFVWATQDAGPTSSGGAIDHVLVRGATLGAAGVARVRESVSDHYPVWADVGLPTSLSAAAAPPRACP